MKITGEGRIAAPIGAVWHVLNNADLLWVCIPGCQSLEPVGDGEFSRWPRTDCACRANGEDRDGDFLRSVAGERAAIIMEADLDGLIGIGRPEPSGGCST